MKIGLVIKEVGILNSSQEIKSLAKYIVAMILITFCYKQIGKIVATKMFFELRKLNIE